MSDSTAKYEPGMHPSLPAPSSTVGIVAWVRGNLFSSPLNAFLTIFAMYIISVVVPPALDWLFVKATFGSERTDCVAEAGSREGACWAYIDFWWKQLMFGRYPDEELWRIHSIYALLIAGIGWLVLPNLKHKGWVALFMLTAFPVIALVMFVGDSFGLMFVETPLWGGMFLTLVIAITGIVASLPIGVVLALGRRSDITIRSPLLTVRLISFST